MKKSVLGAMLAFALMLTPVDTHAESTCSYSEQAELNAIVANVKATYEIVDIYDGQAKQLDSGLPEDPLVDIYIKGFNINVLNVTDDIYISITNDYDGSEKVFHSKDAQDGIISFQSKNNQNVVTYTINVYSNKYKCVGELYRTLTLKTPVYNSFSQYAACTENPEFYYCQEFLSSGKVDFNTFYTQLEKYQETKKVEEEKKEQEKDFIEKIKEFYKNNKTVMNVCIIAIVIAGGAIIVILIVKRRRRVL